MPVLLIFEFFASIFLMSDEELKHLLRENLEVSQESLKILKKINRDRVIGNVYNFLKWSIIIGVSIGLYYYIQPYMDKAQALLQQFNEIQNIQQNLNLQNILPR